MLFDLPARKFFIFGLVFWPQDFIFLTWLLIIAALALFFFTAIGGRLWCGYACPQTVWTETFLWMERFAEGDRNARQKLDRGPWNANKLARKTGKQFMWVTFALWTGFTFVGFFTPIRTLGQEVLAFSLGPWETFWVLFYGFATYGNAGYLREQVCKYMCPYARFQSAMFDSDTLIITYDDERGEPRGARKRGTDPRAQGLGDCIDCTLCVQVCPTGIDIRQGLQIECIACAACIDACDTVMDKMGYSARPDPLHHRACARSRADAPAAAARAHLRRLAVRAGRRLRGRGRAALAGVARRAARPQLAVPAHRRRQRRQRLHAAHPQQDRARAALPHRGARRLGADAAARGSRIHVWRAATVYSLPLRVRRAAYDPLGA